MASRIQGITVEIGGDNTKLQSALKGVSGEIKSTQQQKLEDVKVSAALAEDAAGRMNEAQSFLDAEHMTEEIWEKFVGEVYLFLGRGWRLGDWDGDWVEVLGKFENISFLQ